MITKPSIENFNQNSSVRLKAVFSTIPPPILLETAHIQIILRTHCMPDKTVQTGRLRSGHAHEKMPLDFAISWPGRVAQSVGHLPHKSEVLGLILCLATYFPFS